MLARGVAFHQEVATDMTRVSYLLFTSVHSTSLGNKYILRNARYLSLGNVPTWHQNYLNLPLLAFQKIS